MMPGNRSNGALDTPKTYNATSFISTTIDELLNADSRPTFAVENDSFSKGSHALRPIFLNKALLKFPDLIRTAIDGISSLSTYPAFCHWVHSGQDEDGVLSLTYIHAGHEWHRTKVSHEWIVIGATGVKLFSTRYEKPHTPPVSATEFGKKTTNEWNHARDSDWTRPRNPEKLSKHIQFLRSHDWGATPLGPIDTWQPELRVMANVMMAAPYGASLFWGDDLIYIYNEVQLPSIGRKHPAMLGVKFTDAWAEVANDMRPYFAKGFETGKATDLKQVLFLERNGFLEERHYIFTIIPVAGGDGKIAGFYCPVHDITAQALAQRRLNTVLLVNQHSAGSLSCEELWNHLLTALEWNKEDIVFAALYSYESDHTTDYVPTHFQDKGGKSSGICKLTGAIGIPIDVLDAYIDIEDTTSNIANIFEKALRNDGQILLESSDGSLPDSIVDVVDSSRGHGTKCEKAVLFALRSTSSGRTLGFVLLGLQSKCLYDEDYKNFTDLLGGQIAAALAATVTHQEEIRHREEQAKLEQAILNGKLVQQAREAESAEKRFKTVFDMAASAISITRAEGSLIYANDVWRDLFGWEESDQESMKWFDHIWQEDVQLGASAWQTLVVDRKPIQLEIRLNKPWVDETSPNMNFPYTWILANAYPEFSEDGEVVTVVASMTRISHLKWIQGDAQRRAAEAVEAKRQQDSFTDMVAHEIRNPLNAIVQCSDAVSEILQALRKSFDNAEQNVDSKVLEEAINSAEIITYCANHQKKIINDLLVLSKLDSDLLTFQLSASQPIRLLQQTTRMFRAQANSSDISIESVIHPSIQAHAIDWVMFDPDRVSQVLINLLTNAIKFTAQQEKRSIVLTLEVAADTSSFASVHGIRFFPTNRARSTSTALAAPSDNLLLLYSVRDTGRGVSRIEQERLFQRFSQASLRTHVKYGGSGLGLWISREITEMQGGEIGLVPDQETGSTFAFYVPMSRAQPPQDRLQAPAAPLLKSTSKQGQATERPTGRSAESGNANQMDMNTITILLTEDNILNQNIMKRQLSKVFKTVLVANNGQDALDIVQRTRHWCGSATAKSDQTATSTTAGARPNELDLALILMDIEMPVMDGIECTQRIRAFEQEGALDKHIPIIAISANARAEQIREYLAVGMDETLAKPFLVKDLVVVIRRLLL